MRHMIVLFSASLFACSLVGGAQGKLGGGTSTASEPSGGGGVADQYQAGVEVPRNLMGVDHDVGIMLEKTAELEKKLEDGTLNSPGDIHWVRVTWLTYFGQMQRGGEPRCPACMNNPKYKELKAKTPEINSRLAKLEMAVAKCTYGYRMTNGDLLPMTLDWSEEEWKKIVEKALPAGYMQKERCWTDDKDGKAGKAGSWAY